MPDRTSEITAKKIKDRIRQCDKFILLATNDAVESKWCNWELGYGDALKYQDHIAIFPIKPKGSQDSDYKGAEYLALYPHIRFYDGSGADIYNDGRPIQRGYYVRHKEGGFYYLTPLKTWLARHP